ncbi:flagellar FliJ family protein [Pseudomonas panipatensis]|uniref:Flagellar FliJ protein n=1 Tax=Pseudomonas panipatensis TaxID=428992 RepID=A0A1G8FPW2_9PSED|nr:flagellar FliJ family protein [Pseudomonas panipatensis]SDH84181.1 flagellar export protein FliJ [Pseudomonas panipatensis]SMP52686.1 flagellar export protein FliJ [Pseudomonas panipatensis]
MKEQLDTLRRLAGVRQNRVREMLGRVNYQRGLCQRYRNNITGLTRLCGFVVPVSTSLQRGNQQQYKVTLFKMLALQKRELEVAEQTLARIQGELLQAMRGEKVLEQVIETRMQQWQAQLASQEQKLQDGLAAQTWWRGQGI